MRPMRRGLIAGVLLAAAIAPRTLADAPAAFDSLVGSLTPSAQRSQSGLESTLISDTSPLVGDQTPARTDGLFAPTTLLPPVSDTPPTFGAAAKRTTLAAFGSLGAAGCDGPTHGLYAQVGYDTWRGISDDSWQNNGIHAGVNYGTRLGRFSQRTGIGFQIGGTMGVYDWAGTDYRASDRGEAQPQGFVTYGLFHKPNDTSRWNVAVVQDWMLNSNYGVFSQNPTLSQLRIQTGYMVNPWNEVGIWSAWHVLSDSRFISGVGQTTWRPMNQLNPYWHLKWGPGGADTWLWVGVPERHRLGAPGTLGDYIAGAAANVPLSDRVALYTLVTYMHPSAAAGAVGSEEDAWNFTIGLSFYPARNTRASTVAGQCWMPAMPIANNGTFMVDTNHH